MEKIEVPKKRKTIIEEILDEDLLEEEQEIREEAHIKLNGFQNLLTEFESFNDLVTTLFEKKEELVSNHGEIYFIEELQGALQKARILLDSTAFKIDSLVLEEINEFFNRLNEFMEDLRCVKK